VESPLGKSFVAGWIALIHREQPFVVGDHSPRGIDQRFWIHWLLLHFQFRIPGLP
jgi:hypothetical protein